MRISIIENNLKFITLICLTFVQALFQHRSSTMNLVLLILLNLFILCICQDVDLIKNYFNSRNVAVINMYVCKYKDASKIEKYMRGNFLTKVNYLHKGIASNLTWNYVNFIQGNFIDLRCNENFRVFTNSDSHHFNGSYAWLVEMPGIEMFEDFKQLPLGIHTDMILKLPKGELYEIYKISPLFPLKYKQVGFWDQKNLMLHKEKRTQLDNVTLVGALVLTHLKTDEKNLEKQITNRTYDPQADIFHRQHYELNLFMQKLLNYSVKITRSSTWGYKNDKGQWVGLVYDIFVEKAEIAISPCHIRVPRSEFVYFLPSLQTIRYVYTFRQPKSFGTYKALYLPLTWDVWICIFLIMILIIITYEFIMSIGSVYSDDNPDPGEGLVLVVGAIAQQGLTEAPKAMSGRIISVTVLLLGLLIYTYYNASVMNGLLTPAPNKIQTLEQLTNSFLDVGVINNPYLITPNSFKIAFKEDMRKKIAKTRNKFVNMTAGLIRVRKEKFAFCADDTATYIEIDKYFTEAEKCELFEIDVAKPYPLAFSVAKNSSYREIFSQALIWLDENGLSNRVKSVWYRRRPPCLGKLEFIYVSTESILIALGIFAGGIAASSLILAIEILWNHRTQQMGIIHFRKE